MPVTDLSGGDDWGAWLQSMLQGSGQLGGGAQAYQPPGGGDLLGQGLTAQSLPWLAPPARPYSPTPQPYGGPMAAADAAGMPRGPLASSQPYGGIGSDARYGRPVMSSSSGQGGIGSDARYPLRSSPAAPATATPQSRFTQIDRPNAPANGGPYGSGGPQQMTALDLSRLFRRNG